MIDFTWFEYFLKSISEHTVVQHCNCPYWLIHPYITLKTNKHDWEGGRGPRPYPLPGFSPAFIVTLVWKIMVCHTHYNLNLQMFHTSACTDSRRSRYKCLRYWSLLRTTFSPTGSVISDSVFESKHDLCLREFSCCCMCACVYVHVQVYVCVCMCLCVLRVPSPASGALLARLTVPA